MAELPGHVIERKIPLPDSHFVLMPCKKCRSSNVGYEHYNGTERTAWRVKCFDCRHTVDKGNEVRHDAQMNWNNVDKEI